MNEDTIAGKLKSVGGKIKQSTGEAIGNQNLANSGAADQVTGAVQETWGKTKDAAHDITAGTGTHAAAAEDAHNARTGVTGAAQHAKDSISAGIDNLKHDLHHGDHEVNQVH